MSGWTALIPFKADGAKSRLGGILSREEREALAFQCLDHVMAALEECPDVEEIIVLSPDRPDAWRGQWVADQGRGLNGELQAWRDAHQAANLLIIHADLPHLSHSDISELCALASEKRVAMAVDRTGSGTNALALMAGETMTFRFGADSHFRHLEERRDIGILSCDGLANDIDTPADLALIGDWGGQAVHD
jgi:2-phospho-L-lactate/phosphoenolpyruvate guanylyltransferase